MAIQLEGKIEALRIYEYLTKVLGTSDLANYFLLIDKSGDARAQKVSLAALLAFSGSQFYDNLFKLISNLDDDELTFVRDNLTTDRAITLPDASGLMAVAGMAEAFQFGGQANGGYSVESFSATKTFNLNNGVSQEMVITGNITSLSLSNKVNGGSYLIYLVQNGTGGYTIPTPDSTFGSETDNSAPAFITTANAVNIINVNVRPNGTTYWTLETYTP